MRICAREMSGRMHGMQSDFSYDIFAQFMEPKTIPVTREQHPGRKYRLLAGQTGPDTVVKQMNCHYIKTIEEFLIEGLKLV